MSLEGEIFEAFHSALLSAFDADEFKRLVRFSLGEDIDRITLGKSQADVVYEVIDWTYRNGMMNKFAQSAYARNPHNPELGHFIERYGQDLLDLSVAPEDDLLNEFPLEIRTLRKAYLERIMQEADQLLLSQISSATNLPSRLSLNALYIPLAVKMSALDEATPESIDPESVFDYANKYKQLIVVGGPGSGKSSFSKFLALCMAGELLKKDNANTSTLARGFSSTQQWAHGGLLPIYIGLQDFAASGLIDWASEPTVDLLLKYLDAQLVAAELEKYEEALRTELRALGGILLLDGLDEVSETDGQRLWIQQAVADFALSYPNVRILITSRPYIFSEQSNHLSKFHRVHLAPFTQDQIEAYIACACPLLYSAISGESGSANHQVDALQIFIGQNPSLHKLAQTPLMLTLMVALFTRRGNALPEQREELYDQSIDLLMSVWDQPKRGIEHPDERLQIYQKNIRSALERLAAQIHGSKPSPESTEFISKGELFVALSEATEDNRDINPASVVDYLTDRAGILVQQDAQHYHFPHRMIQEYMAACHLQKHGNLVREITTRVKDDPERWREVLLLSAAREVRVGKHSDAPISLIQRLCPDGFPTDHVEKELSHSALLVMLSGRLLIETGLAESERLESYEKGVIERVKRMLVEVVDGDFLDIDDRLTASLDLGALGDLRTGVGVEKEGLPAISWNKVAPGPFLLGVNLLPCHLIQQPFEISQYPITVSQFNAFVVANGYHQQEHWSVDGWKWRQINQIDGPFKYATFLTVPNQPQVGISWYEAIAFCNWLSIELGQEISLPSEPEWERAARGTDGRTFPWTGELTLSNCNMRQTGIGHPSPVGIFPQNKSPCGSVDMVGNVWEWCSTVWQSSYNNYEKTINNDLAGTSRRVLRGGSWANRRQDVRCANRHRNHPDHRGPNVGFRVVRR